jgi:hypothetical protein
MGKIVKNIFGTECTLAQSSPSQILPCMTYVSFSSCSVSYNRLSEQRSIQFYSEVYLCLCLPIYLLQARGLAGGSATPHFMSGSPIKPKFASRLLSVHSSRQEQTDRHRIVIHWLSRRSQEELKACAVTAE